MGNGITITLGTIMVCPGLGLLLPEQKYGSCDKEKKVGILPWVWQQLFVLQNKLTIENMDCMLLLARHCSKLY